MISPRKQEEFNPFDWYKWRELLNKSSFGPVDYIDQRNLESERKNAEHLTGVFDEQADWEE